ncbi:Bro-N domain-containing protein [Aquimarina sp. MMG016]|uniref:BRO-N domain-containing protein n=1 Tax=Aquimarina sp. MMG016 TaxID=2822690 RepID=UPI001B39D934|nr:Bro-N domain-containing protein [Aquimarina sp. MMG016]MBQ4819707.1 Bro-N domain-containing protein [Aquimarina sp. MMG016]
MEITKKETPNYFQQFPSIKIKEQVWFIAEDVIRILKLNEDFTEILDTLDKEERFSKRLTRNGKRQFVELISESGLYALLFKSDTENAKKFRKWVTNQVLPHIRTRGYYSSKRFEIPNFVIRFNDNWDRVDSGYFSVLSELFIRLYGRFEQKGYILPSKALDGKEMRPDISASFHFEKYLEERYPQYNKEYKTYPHRLPDGRIIEVKQYHNHLLPVFIEFIDKQWLQKYAKEYFEKRDPNALQYLPKLISPTL